MQEIFVSNVVLMLGQRRRRWANIKPTLVKHLERVNWDWSLAWIHTCGDIS